MTKKEIKYLKQTIANTIKDSIPLIDRLKELDSYICENTNTISNDDIIELLTLYEKAIEMEKKIVSNMQLLPDKNNNDIAMMQHTEDFIKFLQEAHIDIFRLFYKTNKVVWTPGSMVTKFIKRRNNE